MIERVVWILAAFGAMTVGVIVGDIIDELRAWVRERLPRGGASE